MLSNKRKKGTNLFIDLSNYMRGKGQTAAEEDVEIVSLCKKGNVDAFEVLVRKRQKRMLNLNDF